LEHTGCIHLITDYGKNAIEHTMDQLLLHKHFPGLPHVFSNQNFKYGDVISPSIFLKLCYSEFPAGTVHMAALHIEGKLPEKYILGVGFGQYFIGPDNGIFPMALGNDGMEYYKLARPANTHNIVSDIFIPTAVTLLSRGIVDFQNQLESNPRTLIMPLAALTGNMLRLTVLYNDSHGNAYLNMEKEEFLRLTEGKRFALKLGFRDEITHIAQSYHDLPEGDKLALFGMGNLLQICVNCGSAEQYLGLKSGKMVMLEIQN
jgi:S-adenosyl-L-methionine hydrolase (adenosine-forming)